MVKKWLKGIIPHKLADSLEEGLGWRIIGQSGQPLEWDVLKEQEEQKGWSISFRGKGEWFEVIAKMEIQFEREFGAVYHKVSLRNEGEKGSPSIIAIHPISLQWLEPEQPILIRTLGGGLTSGFYPSPAYQERTTQLLSFSSEPWTIESGFDGRSSNKDLPFLALVMGKEGIVCGLEWSGLWYMSVHHPFVSLTAGIPVQRLTLDPGESLDLPPAHFVFFEGDLDEGGNALRRYLYEHHCPKLAGRLPLPPVSYDHWFYIVCDFDEELLRREVDICSALSIEYFVLDAGWYAGCGKGGEFSRGVGNWLRVDLAKFPRGIEPLAEYVHSKGMNFGMWFEVERAHRESDIVKEHPEWFLNIGEEFLHLNLARRDAQDGIIQIISNWVEKLGLSWIRWDYNIGPRVYWESADRTGKIQFRYIEGLYRVLDELMKKYPDLLIECCASGGRRIDLGTLKRAHTIWFSDHTDDPNICRFMQSGANRFLPGNLLNSAVPTPLGGGDSGRNIFDFLSRMMGAFSIDGDIASWSPCLINDVKRMIEIYKGFRHLLVQDFYPLTPHPRLPDESEALLFVSRDKREAVLFAFRMPEEPDERIVRLRGLIPNAIYDVEDLLIWWKGKGIKSIKHKGGTLMNKGLLLDLSMNCALYFLKVR